MTAGVVGRFPCRFVVVRYVDDEIRDEAINLGIILQSQKSYKTICKFVTDSQINELTRSLDEKSVSLVTAILEKIKKEASAGPRKDFLDNLVSGYAGGKVQIIGPRVALVENFIDQLEQLYDKYVSIQKHGEREPIAAIQVASYSKGYLLPMNKVLDKIDPDKVTQKVTDPSPTIDTSGIIGLGNVHYYKQDNRKAIELYDRILENPNYAYALNNKGAALFNLAQYQDAIKCYDKAIELKPDYVGAWYNKGLALGRDLGRYEEAIKCYDKAIELKPDYVGAWYNKGLTLYKQGQYQKAIESYDKALEVQPNEADAWFSKGLALYDWGRYEEAVVSYDKAIELKPDYADAWYNKAVALLKLQRNEEADASYDKAIKIKPKDSFSA